MFLTLVLDDMSFVIPPLAQIGPRILIPGVFIGQKVATLSDSGEIAQTIAFSFLFVSFAVNIFGETPWISIIPGIAALSYWMMLKHKENTNLYRYGDWAVTTPIMLFSILNANGVSLVSTLAILLLNLLMIATGYIGVNEDTMAKKNAWFALGCILFIPIIYVLLQLKSTKYAVFLTLFMWSLYPIVWYLDEIKTITKTQTTISYSVMDVLSKLGLLYLLNI
jgi:bacteriorhodopsin